jgi:D-3-phosphoglycerate dehydrogenase
VDGYIAGLDEITRSVIAAAPRLKVIARYGVGVDNVDLEAARERGIVVTNTPGANASSVAELTIGFILALARQILVADRGTRNGDWPRLEGWAIEGKTVGLLGLGAIGKCVAIRLQGFGCQVIAYDPYLDTTFAAAHQIEPCSMEQVLARSDVVSLHLPLMPQTKNVVDVDFLAQMKPGAFLINTARGELIDEAALLAALQSGHLRGAALDALASEPPPPDHPFFALPQVIITPHMGAHADSAITAMGRAAIANCLAVLEGREAPNRVI